MGKKTSKKPTSFSKYFNLNKTQAELDFVDITLHDIPLYIDPYALTTREDHWSIYCHNLVVNYFKAVLKAVKDNDLEKGVRLLSHLGEPEETYLGVSKPGNKGRGIGRIQANVLFDALRKSKAATSGLLEDLSDFALFIPLIGRDKISDITTNIIRGPLISYTQDQCDLYDIPTQNVPSGFYWDLEKREWAQDYTELPIFEGRKIILVPKYSVRYQVGVDHNTYRSKFVLEFLREEHLRAGDSLVTVIKNKEGKIIKKIVFKKTVDRHYPKDKEFLAEFSIAHPEVIDQYRDALKNATSKIPGIDPPNFSEAQLAEALKESLMKISTGVETANQYHKTIIGIINFLFFPNMIYPKKEHKINEGRKRIDILYTNGKENGFFYRISLDKNIKANFIHVECKNYSNEIENAEFDQLLGRFDHNRGKLGMLFFRSSKNSKNVLSRCRDAAKSNLGIILPIDDNFIFKALEHVINKSRGLIDKEISDLYQEIVS